MGTKKAASHTTLHNISNTLAILMSLRGIKDADLAQHTKVPISSITKLRLGYYTNPTVETLIPLANYFRVSLDQLAGLASIDGIPTAPPPSEIPMYRVPILELSEVRPWVEGTLDLRQNHPETITDLPLEEGAFAIVAKGSLVAPAFREGAILIFEQLKNKESPKDCSYVMVLLAKDDTREARGNEFQPSELPGIKEIRFDGADFFLDTLNPSLGTIVKNPICTILAMMQQIKITL